LYERLQEAIIFHMSLSIFHFPFQEWTGSYLELRSEKRETGWGGAVTDSGI
jgi:hypothetical protein